MKIVSLVVLLLYIALPTTVSAQTIEEAVEFVYCGDRGWSECVYTGELDDCSLLLESKPLDDGLIDDPLKFKVHFNNFIWGSATANRFTNEFNVKCQEACVEDINENLGEFHLFYLGDVFDKADYKFGFVALADRVMKALAVVREACPGVGSKF
ncbi:MAG: hypothetical protein HQ498_04495 [Pseudohongiella sp.]|nr:hypothetical protein [Pseudohongiella sp.]